MSRPIRRQNGKRFSLGDPLLRARYLFQATHRHAQSTTLFLSFTNRSRYLVTADVESLGLGSSKLGRLFSFGEMAVLKVIGGLGQLTAAMCIVRFVNQFVGTSCSKASPLVRSGFTFASALVYDKCSS